MGGHKAFSIGSISEKATLASLTEFFTQSGIEVYNKNKILEDYNNVINFTFNNHEYTQNTSFSSSLIQGKSLGLDLAQAIIIFLAEEKYNLNNLVFKPKDTSANTSNTSKTDDLEIKIFSKKNDLLVFHKKFSQKTKTKSINRMDGNSSGNNGLFLEKIFKGTNILKKYPKILEIGSDDDFRDLLREHESRLNKIKEENNNNIPLEFIPEDVKNHPNWKKPLSSAPDVASILVNKDLGFEGFKYGNKSNNDNWKKIAQQRLKLAVEYSMTLPEFKTNIAEIGKNLKKNAGIREDVHLVISAKKSPESPSTFNYISLNCKKYSKIVDKQVKSIYINNNSKGGIEFIVDDLKFPIDYVPKGFKFTFDFLKYIRQ